MNTAENSINWFEIPVTDMQRAKHFYQVVFSIHMQEEMLNGMHMAYFPYDMNHGKVSGALVRSEVHRPGQDGVLIYLNANPNLQLILEKAESEGAQILLRKTEISPEVGYMAFFIDTEGNRIGLHSQE